MKTMTRLLLIAAACFFLSSCAQLKPWEQAAVIPLDGIAPIGLTVLDGQIWVSDGDHNRLITLEMDGKIVGELDGFERPMHIDQSDGALYIPEYGKDQITILKDGKRSMLPLSHKLDAPAGVSVFGKEVAIADFYNHQVLFFNGQDWLTFGEKGKSIGQFHYPTDVQITKSEVYIADAYNNRVQVFDKQGNHQRIIGQGEKMNAATGIYVSAKELFVTDFENDRLLIYDLKGELKQVISEGLDKPTDVLVIDGALYVANYQGKNIVVFSR